MPVRTSCSFVGTAIFVSCSLGLGSAAGCSGDDGGALAPDGSVDRDASALADGDASDVDTAPDAADAGGGAIGSAGCGKDGVVVGTSATTITVDGARRSFRIHAPPGYRNDRPTPVVLMLHGGGGSGDQLQNESSKMDPVADREGFITVYPDGTGVIRTWNGGICCGKAVHDGVDDVAFIAALLDHLEAKVCADLRRVFATGMSNGAILAHRLACELSDRVAAVAPVAGTIGIASCQPTSPVAVLQIHGTSDGHVPWDGGAGCGPAGVSFVSVPSTMEGWRERNGCTAETSPYLTQGNGSCAAFQGCTAAVVLCSIEGGGHSWPGGEPKDGAVDCPADGPQSMTFLASEAAWRFFRENPKAK